MIFDLAKDFTDVLDAMPREHPRRRLVTLLDEALRRDVHFLDRRPTTFFQCVWNASAGTDADSTTGIASLRNLAERWRRQRIATSPSSPWVRSLRPPAVALGRGVHCIYDGHADEVLCFAASRGDDLALTSDNGGELHAWSFAGGKAESRTSTSAVFEHLHLLPGGRIAAATRHRIAVLGGFEIQVLNAQTLLPLLSWPAPERVSAMTCDRGGQRLIAGLSDKTVRVYSLETGAETAVLKGHVDAITGVAVSPDGRRIASCAGEFFAVDRSVRVWDVMTGKAIAELKHDYSAWTCVTFSPDGRALAAGNALGRIVVWTGHDRPPQTLDAHRGGVTAIAYSPDGRFLISGGEDRAVRRWDANTRQPAGACEGMASAISTVINTPHGDVAFASGSRLWIWRPEFSVDQPFVVADQHSGPVQHSAISSDGERGVTVCELDGFVLVWDLRSGECTATISSGHETLSATCAAFTARDEALAVGYTDSSIRMYDDDTGTEIRRYVGHDRDVEALAFSSDSRRLASAAGDGTIRVWNLATGEVERVISKGSDYVDRLRFGENSRYLLSTNTRGAVRGWRTADGQEFSPGEVGRLAKAADESTRAEVAAESTGDVTTVFRHSLECGWYPENLRAISVHNRRLLGGTVDGHVHILSLETTGSEFAEPFDELHARWRRNVRQWELIDLLDPSHIACDPRAIQFLTRAAELPYPDVSHRAAGLLSSN